MYQHYDPTGGAYGFNVAAPQYAPQQQAPNGMPIQQAPANWMVAPAPYRQPAPQQYMSAGVEMPAAPQHHMRGGYYAAAPGPQYVMAPTPQQPAGMGSYGQPANGGNRRGGGPNVYGQQRQPPQNGMGSAQSQAGDGATTYANLFVNRLPDGVTHADLLQVFADYHPKSATVMTDHKTGKSKGFGFIQFSVEEDGKKAHQALHHKTVEVRSLSFVLRAFPSKHDANQSVEVSPVLYVRNVPKMVPKPQVEAMLESLGSVVFCAMREEPDGLPVWVILVEYDCQQCADNALSHLRINTTLYPEHRAVIAKYAKPMERKRHEPKANAVPCPFKTADGRPKEVIRFGESSPTTPAPAANGAKPSPSTPFVVTTSANVSDTTMPKKEASAPDTSFAPAITSPRNAPLSTSPGSNLGNLLAMDPFSTSLTRPNGAPTATASGHQPIGSTSSSGANPLGEPFSATAPPSSSFVLAAPTLSLPADRLDGSAIHKASVNPADITAMPGFTLENDEGSPLDHVGQQGRASKAPRGSTGVRRPRADSDASTMSDASRAATACNSSGIFSFNSGPPTMNGAIGAPGHASGMGAVMAMVPPGMGHGPMLSPVAQPHQHVVPYCVVVDNTTRNPPSFGGDVQLGNAVLGNTNTMSGAFTPGGLTPALAPTGAHPSIPMGPSAMMPQGVYNSLLMSTESQNPMGMSAGAGTTGACGSETSRRTSRTNSFSITSPQANAGMMPPNGIRHFVPTSPNGVISPTHASQMAMGGVPPLFMPSSPLHDAMSHHDQGRSGSAHSSSMSTSNVAIAPPMQQQVQAPPTMQQMYSPFLQQQSPMNPSLSPGQGGPIIYFQGPSGGQMAPAGYY